MAAQFTKNFVQDLQQGIKIRQCGTIVFNGDNESNVITVEVYNGQEPYSGGGSVVGAVICPDGATVALTGSLSGNVATVTLTGDCFAIPGQIGVGVQVINGDVKTTVLKAIYNVELLETDTVVYPGSRITISVGDLVQEIKDALATIPADLTNLKAAEAPDFSTSVTYTSGQYVWYDGKLYKFTAAHPAGSWIGTDAVQIGLGTDLYDYGQAMTVKKNLFAPSSGLPYERTYTSSSATPTLMNTYSVCGATYVDMKAGRIYLAVIKFHIEADDGSTAGSVRVVPTKKNTSSEEPVTMLEKKYVGLSTAPKNSDQYIFNIGTVETDTSVYYKAVAYSSGTTSRTYHITFQTVTVFEFGTVDEALAFVNDQIDHITLNGWTTANDYIARKNVATAQNDITVLNGEAADLFAAAAPDFGTGTAYASGQYVWYEGDLYRFTADHAAGSWTGTDAVQATIGGELSDHEETIQEHGRALNIKNSLFNPKTGLPYTKTSTTSADQVTLMDTSSASVVGDVYADLVAGKVYLTVIKFHIGSDDGSTAGTVRIVPTKKNTPSDEPVTMLKRQDVSLATAPKDTDQYIYQIGSVSADVSVYYKVVSYSSGTTSRTYNITFNSVTVLEFDTQDEALAFVTAQIDNINQAGWASAIDLVARKEITDMIGETSKVVDCLGDSHTAGVGGYTPYPSVLASQINNNAYTVNNFGGGGNGASDITAMQGALYAVCGPFTVADSSSYSNNAPLTMYSGDALKQFGMRWKGINKDDITGNLNCRIDGRAVYVSYSDANGFRIKPVSTGSGDIVITRPTKILTTYMQTDFKDHILCLCMGSNDAHDATVQKVADWNRLIAEQYKRYIIIAEPTMLTASERTEYNKLMYAYFGTHFIDINYYMIHYGLADAGITPTAEDEEAIAQGKTPPSLMHDSVHYNQYGINVMADQIYKKGVELGYW